MTTITVKDLAANQNLDQEAMGAIAGGLRFGGFGFIRPFQDIRPSRGGFIQQNVYNIDYDKNIYQYQPNNTYINAANDVENTGNFFLNIGVNPTQVGIDL